MSESLLPPRFLFRWSVPCAQVEPLAKLKRSAFDAHGLKLGETQRIVAPCELDGQRPFADVRVAWCEAGLAVAALVEGKRRQPRGDEDRPLDSEGLELWIDTRDTHNVHRATRFCHHFVLLPNGGGPKREAPLALQFFINRAKENANRAQPQQLWVRSEKRVNGYLLEAFLQASALTGYDPQENPRLGFTYALRDDELGIQTFSCPVGFPYREDPSLWGTLELTR